MQWYNHKALNFEGGPIYANSKRKNRTKDSRWGTTVRATAQAYDKVSKSTVHKDLTERLEDISKSLYDEVQMILNKNKEERAMRGGMSTRQKYLDMKK